MSRESERMDFFEELEEIAAQDNFVPFSIVLHSGDRYLLEEPNRLFKYSTMNVLYLTNGDECMFQFPAICAMEIHHSKQK